MSEDELPKSSHSGRWPKGVSGNPNGRPSRKNVVAALDRAEARLAMKLGVTPMDIQDQIAGAHIDRCLAGDMTAVKEYYDRRDGKVPTPIGGADELGPIQAIVTGVIREQDDH